MHAGGAARRRAGCCCGIHAEHPADHRVGKFQAARYLQRVGIGWHGDQRAFEELMPLVADALALFDRLALERLEPDRDSTDDAHVDEPCQLVDLGGCGLLDQQVAAKPAALDAHVLPKPDRLVDVVIKQRNRMALKVREFPAVSLDHVAVTVDARVAHDEVELLRLGVSDLLENGFGVVGHWPGSPPGRTIYARFCLMRLTNPDLFSSRCSRSTV